MPASWFVKGSSEKLAGGVEAFAIVGAETEVSKIKIVISI